MFCSNCFVDIYKKEEYAICMKCTSFFCLNCEQFNEETDLYYTDDDKNVYKKKCSNCQRK